MSHDHMNIQRKFVRLRTTLNTEVGDALDGLRTDVDSVMQGIESTTLLDVDEWWRISKEMRSTADATVREAWACRCATSLHAVLGQAVHEAAAMIARALRDGRRPPPYEALLTHVRGQLARVWRARDAAAFRQRPTRGGFLLERLHGGDVDEDTLVEELSTEYSLLDLCRLAKSIHGTYQNMIALWMVDDLIWTSIDIAWRAVRRAMEIVEQKAAATA